MPKLQSRQKIAGYFGRIPDANLDVVKRAQSRISVKRLSLDKKRSYGVEWRFILFASQTVESFKNNAIKIAGAEIMPFVFNRFQAGNRAKVQVSLMRGFD